MSGAGIRLRGGRLVWVKTGSYEVMPLSRVTVTTENGTVEGVAVITPGQLLRPVAVFEGRVVQTRENLVDLPDCSELPHAELPFLGQRVATAVGEGFVAALDVLKARVRVECEDGTSVEMDASEIE
ncbi:MAG TPA: hypothetical protein VF898_00675 [Chloroflexota bacterium]